MHVITKQSSQINFTKCDESVDIFNFSDRQSQSRKCPRYVAEFEEAPTNQN